MGHLRQKLEADPARPQHLLTETRIGYRFYALADPQLALNPIGLGPSSSINR